MNIKILIELFETKNSKRRKALFSLFQDHIFLEASLDFIAQMINKELGIPNLVKSDDIRYCRFYFKNKMTTKTTLREVPKSTCMQETRNEKQEAIQNTIVWTNPDEENINQITKSKFSKL